MPANQNVDRIKDFNHVAFAQELASQAKELIPPDISESDKAVVVNFVHQYTLMAGEAIKCDPSVNFDRNKAEFLSQIVAEWTFHKSIDLIRGGIIPELRKGILDQVARTAYEILKIPIQHDMPQEKMIELVEFHVKNSYKKALEDLSNRNVIQKDDFNNAVNQSNMDMMAQQQTEEALKHETYNDISDVKKGKLASLVFLVRNYPDDKIKSIINKFDKKEATILAQYMHMKDFETKFNPSLAATFLSDMKKHLPKPKKVSYERCYMQLCKIVKNSEKSKIDSIISNERPNVKKLVMSAYNDTRIEMPAMVMDTICKHLREKVLQ